MTFDDSIRRADTFSTIKVCLKLYGNEVLTRVLALQLNILYLNSYLTFQYAQI